MQFKWVDSLMLIRLTSINNEVSEWSCNSWNRSKIKQDIVSHEDLNQQLPSNIFDVLNKYLAGQSFEVQCKLESLYKEAYDIFIYKDDESFEYKDHVNVELFDKRLNNIIYRIFILFDWEECKTWCITMGGMNLNVGIKDALGDNDSASTTYFTKDYVDLLVFSVLIKLIMPIWGLYFSVMKGYLGQDFVLIHALELIKNDFIINNPAFIKLSSYVNAFITKYIKVPGYTLVNDIGATEMPDYMLALALWKKICIFDGRAYERNMVKDIHALLTDKCDRVNRGGPTAKKLTNANGDEVALADLYKVVQRVPPAVEVMVSIYVKTFIKDIEPSVKQEAVNELKKELNGMLEIMSFHIPIAAIVCGNMVSNRNIQLVKYEALIDILAVTALALSAWGFPTIAEILITQPKERDMYSISLSSTSIQLPVPANTLAQLASIYTFVAPNNPGLKLIDSVVQETNKYIWSLKQGKIENLANEIANLLIKMANQTLLINKQNKL